MKPARRQPTGGSVGGRKQVGVEHPEAGKNPRAKWPGKGQPRGMVGYALEAMASEVGVEPDPHGLLLRIANVFEPGIPLDQLLERPPTRSPWGPRPQGLPDPPDLLAVPSEGLRYGFQPLPLGTPCQQGALRIELGSDGADLVVCDAVGSGRPAALSTDLGGLVKLGRPAVLGDDLRPPANQEVKVVLGARPREDQVEQGASVHFGGNPPLLQAFVDNVAARRTRVDVKGLASTWRD